ncbi:MAG: hypothetical protein ACYDD4_04795 [Acidimicrobiales bacterium]
MAPHRGVAVSPSLAALARPLSDRRDRVLPLRPDLAALVPGGGLARGQVVGVWSAPPGTVGGASTLSFLLLAAASAAGWCAAVGIDDPGVVAMSELGVDLDRLVLIPRPGLRWAEVTAALFDGVDVILLRPPSRVNPAVARQLTARARHAGVCLILQCARRAWPEGPDVHMKVVDAAWEGIGQGHGHLQRRRVLVEVAARRGAHAAARGELWIPA